MRDTKGSRGRILIRLSYFLQGNMQIGKAAFIKIYRHKIWNVVVIQWGFDALFPYIAR